MKRIAIILGLLFGLILSVGISSIKAQALPPELSHFEGDWVGFIQIPESGKTNIRLKIAGNDVQLFYKDIYAVWQPFGVSKYQFNPQKETAVYSWIKAGSCRKETISFALTIKEDHMIEVGFTRQIETLRIFNGNETEKIEGLGKLWRTD